MDQVVLLLRRLFRIHGDWTASVSGNRDMSVNAVIRLLELLKRRDTTSNMEWNISSWTVPSDLDSARDSTLARQSEWFFPR